jgi:hypothetical protein
MLDNAVLVMLQTGSCNKNVVWLVMQYGCAVALFIGYFLICDLIVKKDGGGPADIFEVLTN